MELFNLKDNIPKDQSDVLIWIKPFKEDCCEILKCYYIENTKTFHESVSGYSIVDPYNGEGRFSIKNDKILIWNLYSEEYEYQLIDIEDLYWSYINDNPFFE